jgi:hypothetical protein
MRIFYHCLVCVYFSSLRKIEVMMNGQGTPARRQSVFGNDLATFIDTNDRFRKLAGIIPWNALIPGASVHYVQPKGRTLRKLTPLWASPI